MGTESAGRGPLGKDSLGGGVSAQPHGVQSAQPAEIWGERDSEDRSLEARAPSGQLEDWPEPGVAIAG